MVPPGIAGSTAGGGWISPGFVVVVLSGIVVVELGWSATLLASRRSAVAGDESLRRSA
jgi:hypothetical protein